MIKQGTKIICGCCKFLHSLISEGYVELMTVCPLSICLFVSSISLLQEGDTLCLSDTISVSWQRYALSELSSYFQSKVELSQTNTNRQIKAHQKPPIEGNTEKTNIHYN